jgi:hypothetical protein
VRVGRPDFSLRFFKLLNAVWVVCFAINFILWIVYWSIWFADKTSVALSIIQMIKIMFAFILVIFTVLMINTSFFFDDSSNVNQRNPVNDEQGQNFIIAQPVGN